MIFNEKVIGRSRIIVILKHLLSFNNKTFLCGNACFMRYSYSFSTIHICTPCVLENVVGTKQSRGTQLDRYTQK